MTKVVITEDAFAYRKTVMDMVREFSETLGQKPNPYTYLNLIDEEFQEWLEAAYPDGEDDAEAELKELSDLVYVIYGYANSLGYNLDEAIRRVHGNNLGRCIQPDGSIHRREDGKVLKNPDYPKVDLSDLV